MRNHFLAATAALVLSLCAPAQSINAPATAAPGEKVTVSYTNASLAGQTVTISATTGYPPTTSNYKVKLDAQGHGDTNVTMPSSGTVRWNAPGATEEVTVIV